MSNSTFFRFKTAADFNESTTKEWIGSNYYPKKYPKNSSNGRYIPCTELRELLSGLTRIFNTAINNLNPFDTFSLQNKKLLNRAIDNVFASRFSYSNDTLFSAVLNNLKERILNATTQGSIYECCASIFLSFHKEVRTLIQRDFGPCIFHPQDFTVAKMNHHFYVSNKGYVHCVSFAMYHLHLESTFKDCFAPVKPSSITLEDIEKNWGLVQTENPQCGDLAIYCNTTFPKEGSAKHLSICFDNESVVSGWGTTGDMTKHAFDEVPLEYGDSLKFYRKKTRFVIIGDFVKKLQTAQKELSSTEGIPSQNLASLVLSVKGVVSYCERHFEKVYLQYALKMLPFSLMGRSCLAPLQAQIQASIRKYTETLQKIEASEEFSITKKREVLVKVQKIVERVSRKLPLNHFLLCSSPSNNKSLK